MGHTRTASLSLASNNVRSNPDLPSEGGLDTWIAIFDICAPGSDLEWLGDGLLDALVTQNPVVSVSGDQIVCTFSVVGTAQTAIARAVESLWTALETCHAPQAQVVAANVISSREFDRQQAEQEPLK